MSYLYRMKTKKCNGECGKKKPISEFYENKQTKDGFFSSCKGCVSKQKMATRKTKRGLLAKIYDGQNLTSKRRGDPPPSYSFDWLFEWAMAQRLYHNLFKFYVDSGYDKWLKPSVDRINDYDYYHEGNIQLTTWRENHNKCRANQLDGINNKTNIKTYQCFPNGDVFMEYHSVRSAERKTGIAASNICAAIKGTRQKTAGGYIWRH